MRNEAVLEVVHAPIIPTINGLVALEAVLNQSSDLQPFVDQVLMVSRLMVRPVFLSSTGLGHGSPANFWSLC